MIHIPSAQHEIDQPPPLRDIAPRRLGREFRSGNGFLCPLELGFSLPQRQHQHGAFGLEAQDLVKRLNVRFAILSVGAVNAEMGFMLHDLQEANLARLAIDNAQIRVVVADGEKLGKRAPVTLDALGKINVLFTYAKPDASISKMLSKNEIDHVCVNKSKQVRSICQNPRAPPPTERGSIRWQQTVNGIAKLSDGMCRKL
ncbi:hypothetical protein [uncultured Ruegeria sp.]|uniref:hypothetical protein n=1 Tax=uncultured Ruegeria sp. TaxID=259304 RepID=UPI002633AB52|nr:hypothetical protein [uncultured Ruegeria sp.]